MTGKPRRYSTPGPRFIYPAVCQSIPVANCTPMAQLLFDRLIAQADDQGRLPGDPRSVRAVCMPMIDDATPEAIEGWLDELAKQRLIIRYAAEDRQLIQIRGWWDHQQNMRWSYPSRWPEPEGWQDRVRVRSQSEGGQEAETVGQVRTASPRPDLTQTGPDSDSDNDSDSDSDRYQTLPVPRPPSSVLTPDAAVDLYLQSLDCRSTVLAYVKKLCYSTGLRYENEGSNPPSLPDCHDHTAKDWTEVLKRCFDVRSGSVSSAQALIDVAHSELHRVAGVDPYRDATLAPDALRQQLIDYAEEKGVTRSQLSAARARVTFRSSDELTVGDIKAIKAKLDDPNFTKLLAVS